MMEMVLISTFSSCGLANIAPGGNLNDCMCGNGGVDGALPPPLLPDDDNDDDDDELGNGDSAPENMLCDAVMGNDWFCVGTDDDGCLFLVEAAASTLIARSMGKISMNCFCLI